MKKAIALTLVLLSVLLAAGCGESGGDAVPKQLAKYVTKGEGDYWFLTLPVSGERVTISPNERALLEKIDLDLLREAEETLLAKIPANEQGHAISLGSDEGQPVLYGEVIVPIDPPRIREDGATTGCGIDHDHIYLDAVPISR